jgi:hypothetical protein
MKGPAGYGKILNLGMNVVICLGLSIYVLMMLQGRPEFVGVPVFTPIALVQSFVASFAVGYTCGDLIPAFSWGQKLTVVLRMRNKVGAYIIENIVLGFCFAITITFVISFINNIVSQGMAGVLGFFVAYVPGIIVVAIVLIMLFRIPLSKLATTISGFDPAASFDSH